MREHVEHHFGLVKTTLLGGIVFLLPLAIVGWFVGYAGGIAFSAYNSIYTWLDESENVQIHEYAHLQPWVYLMLSVGTIAVLLLVCFVAGMLARRSLGQWFTRKAEGYLSMLFPRYAVFKDQLTGNLGGGTLQPVLARIGAETRIGMVVERDNAGRVALYLPGAPDPWSGKVVLVDEADITEIDAPYIDVMTTFEQLGRDMLKYAPKRPQA